MGDDAKAPYLLPQSHITALIVQHYLVSNHYFRTNAVPNLTGLRHFWRQIRDESEVKGCLLKALCRRMVSLEELQTSIVEATCISKHRPLTCISEDGEECLTPAHLIFGRPAVVSPPLNQLADDELPYEEDIDLREQRIRLPSVLSKFEKSWQVDYLTALREHHYTCAHDMGCAAREGELVPVDLDSRSCQWWPLGHISRLIDSADGIVRSAEVQVGMRRTTGRRTRQCS